MRLARVVLVAATVVLLAAAGPAVAQTFVFGAQGEPISRRNGTSPRMARCGPSISTRA